MQPSTRLVLLALGVFSAHGLAQGPRHIQQLGAAVPGKSITARLLAPAASNGKAFVFAVSGHTDRASQQAPFAGLLRLDAASIGLTIAGAFPVGKSIADLTFKLPASAALVGRTVDAQFLDAATTPATFSEEAVVTMVSGVGSALFAQTDGTGFTLRRAQNTTVGKPTSQTSASYVPVPVLASVPRGWVQGFFRGFVGSYQVDPAVHRGNTVARDQGNSVWGTIALPTGKRFCIGRDAQKPSQFACLLIDDKTGTVTEIPGTRATSLSTASPPLSAYNDSWAIAADGITALGLINFGTTNTNVRDKVVLVRLDGSNWPTTRYKMSGEGTPTLDVTPPTTSAPTFSIFEGSSMWCWIANEVAMFQTSAGTFFVPLNGKAPAIRLNYPLAGTGAAPFWNHGSSVRISDDGRTVVLPRGHVASSAPAAHDFYAIVDIDAAASKTRILNITQFKTNTPLERFIGDRRTADTVYQADLTRDGELVAFLGGNGGTSVYGPNTLYVVPTNGRMAGSVKPLGSFPAAVTWMGSPFILPGKSAVLVFAGSAADRFDLYRVDLNLTRDAAKQIIGVAASKTTNLTNKGDIDVRFTLVSENGRYMYFSRDYGGSSSNPAHDLVGFDSQSGKLFSVSGSEFGTGGPSLELRVEVDRNELRLAAANSGEMFFVGRPVRSAGTVIHSDMNVYKFDLEKGGIARSVTSYTGTSADLGKTLAIANLNLLRDGSLVYAVHGSAGQVVTYLKASSGKPVGLGRFARGSHVAEGSIRVLEGAGAVTWVQSGDSIGATSARGYFARLDDSMAGHPLQLTDLARAPSQFSFLVNLAIGSTNN